MLANEIPMDSLMALAAERRRRYTDEARRYRLGRVLARARRRRGRARGPGVTGTRVTATGPCA